MKLIIDTSVLRNTENFYEIWKRFCEALTGIFSKILIFLAKFKENFLNIWDTQKNSWRNLDNYEENWITF